MQTAISVNFAELERSAVKLTEQACETEYTADRIKKEAILLNEMGLYSYAEMLDMCGNGIADVSSELEILNRKLKKVISVYEDTETEQRRKVMQLPDKAVSVGSITRGVKINSFCNISNIPDTGMFYGHFIENEEWLDKLIMDWRSE